MKFVAITESGEPAEAIAVLPEAAQGVRAATAALYRKAGYRPPWIGYLVVDEGACIGTCAFTAPPADSAVEIAYFTFPQNEGRGYATRMARRLIAIARAADPKVKITAHTLPQAGASTRVLEKCGFVLEGDFDHAEDGRVWLWRLPQHAECPPRGLTQS